jgi:hypothetical protein
VITEADKAWLAGVVDACAAQTSRGYVVLYGRAPVLQRAAQLLGLQMRSYDSHAAWRYQCSEHCPEAHVHVIGGTYNRLNISGTRCLVMLTNLAPYLTGDYSTVLGLLQGNKYRRHTICDHMRSLGWSVPDAPLCSVDGCPRMAAAKGMCNKHYKKILWRKS